MKHIKQFFAAIILISIATTGVAQTQAKLDQLVAKSNTMVEGTTTVTGALNKKANPNPSAITEMEYFNGTFDTAHRTVFTYNANGDILQETGFYYDYSTGNFELDSRELYTYNSSNEATEYLIQSWDDSIWVDQMRQTVKYTAQGDMEEVLVEVPSGSDWVLYYGIRINYTYDSNNNPTEAIIELNQTGSWTEIQKQLITYDSNNEPTEIITQIPAGSGWDNYSRMINMTWHKWGGTNEQLFSYAETQDWDGSQWADAGRQTNTYTNDDMPVSTLIEEWDGSTYVNSEHYNWTYDQYGNQEFYVEEEYEIAAGTWDTTYGERSEYTYNSDNSIDTETLASYNSIGWETDSKNLYEYESTSGFTKNRLNTTLQAYPNPTTDVLNLKLEEQRFTVTITDLTGRTVLQAQNNRALDVSNLKKGIYLVHIAGEKGNAAVKFVKN